MVNLRKKSSSGKGKDFEKPKVKVGKVKPGAVNATNTSFESRRLTLREQQLSTQQKVASFAHDQVMLKTSLLALIQPYLAKCGHYNVQMRLGAISDILNKCRGNPGELCEVKGQLLEILGKFLIDNSAAVRDRALSLLIFLLTREAEGLTPFFGGWVSFLVLAASHINVGIREDAVRYLEAVLRVNPTVLCPWIGILLKSFTTFSKPSAKPSKKVGDLSEIVGNLIDLYCRNSSINGRIQPEPLTYQWQSNQRIPLGRVHLRGSTKESLVEPLKADEITSISNWLGRVMQEEYLEVRAFEKEALLQFRIKCKRLVAFCAAAEVELEALRSSLPKSLQSVDILSFSAAINR